MRKPEEIVNEELENRNKGKGGVQVLAINEHLSRRWWLDFKAVKAEIPLRLGFIKC